MKLSGAHRPHKQRRRHDDNNLVVRPRPEDLAPVILDAHAAPSAFLPKNPGMIHECCLPAGFWITDCNFEIGNLSIQRGASACACVRLCLRIAYLPPKRTAENLSLNFLSSFNILQSNAGYNAIIIISWHLRHSVKGSISTVLMQNPNIIINALVDECGVWSWRRNEGIAHS